MNNNVKEELELIKEHNQKISRLEGIFIPVFLLAVIGLGVYLSFIAIPYLNPLTLPKWLIIILLTSPLLGIGSIIAFKVLEYGLFRKSEYILDESNAEVLKIYGSVKDTRVSKVISLLLSKRPNQVLTDLPDCTFSSRYMTKEEKKQLAFARSKGIKISRASVVT